MYLAFQLMGDGYSSTDIITTNSPDIVVGPIVVTDEGGTVVETNGNVIQTIFFINITAAAQTVEVSINGLIIERTFEIIPITGTLVGSGDYSAAAPGTYTLGDGGGDNGNRTKGGVIVLDELIVPPGVSTITKSHYLEVFICIRCRSLMIIQIVSPKCYWTIN